VTERGTEGQRDREGWGFENRVTEEPHGGIWTRSLLRVGRKACVHDRRMHMRVLLPSLVATLAYKHVYVCEEEGDQTCRADDSARGRWKVSK
jgi:hypothetical protein